MFPDTDHADHAEGPLTHSRLVSGSLHHEQSEVLQEAAGNLLSKAAARLAKGEEDEARKLVRRAVDLPYDDFEEVAPAAWWLALEMSIRLTEEVELAAEGDSRWVDRAEILLAELSGPAAEVVRSGLHDVLSEFSLPRPEQQRISQLLGEEPLTELKADEESAIAVLRALNRQSELYARDLH